MTTTQQLDSAHRKPRYSKEEFARRSEAMPDTILESCREFILSKISSEAVEDLQISDDNGLTVNLSFHEHIEDEKKEAIVMQINYAFREFQQNLTRA